jgi:phosphatidylglycerophosphatase A
MIPLIKRRKRNNPHAGSEPSFATKLFCSGLFSGYLPVASGTAGSFLAVCLYLIPGFETPAVFAPVIIIVLAIGTKASDSMARWYGDDPAEVTIDEIAGMWISLFLLPKKPLVIIAAFMIFRILDIVKPFPARKFDTMHSGTGIMMDDVVSGIYTNFIIQVLLELQPLSGFLLR